MAWYEPLVEITFNLLSWNLKCFAKWIITSSATITYQHNFEIVNLVLLLWKSKPCKCSQGIPDYMSYISNVFFCALQSKHPAATSAYQILLLQQVILVSYIEKYQESHFSTGWQRLSFNLLRSSIFFTWMWINNSGIVIPVLWTGCYTYWVDSKRRNRTLEQLWRWWSRQANSFSLSSSQD